MNDKSYVDGKNPKVSIIIPVYNGENYVEEAIRSAINQTYDNIEILVINDGSKDNTENICMQYMDKIKYFKKENGGVSTVLNLALEKMTGEYFSWLSHDDYYYPNKVEEEVKQIEDDRTILMSDYGLIDENGYCYNKVVLSHEVVEMHHEFALLKGFVNGITLLIPKRAFDECGKFDETLRCGQDYEMWFRMMLKGYRFKHIPKVLACTRIHSNQVTNTSPRVKSEGNQLWINMMKDLPIETKEKINNTEYNFYRQMVKVLEETPYDEALMYAKNKLKELKNTSKMNNDDILVSVIMPFYDETENILRRSIESVLKQTHKNIELIVINDNPELYDRKIIDNISNDARIIYIENSNNMGVSYSRNYGIEIAKGKYIAFLDGDDEFYQNKIEEQLNELELCQENISHTSYLRCSEKESTEINSGKLTEYIYRHCIYNCPIATPTVMIKKVFLEKNKIRFNQNIGIGEDTCFWLDILTKTSIVGIDEPLTKVYTNETSAAYNTDKQIIGLGNIVEYLRKNEILQHYQFEISVIEGIYRDAIKYKNLQIVEGYTPKVSIIIPVHNGEKYISFAIDSALRQTYSNIEIIVVDYGSNDKTESICKKYREKIKYIREEEGGISSALNTGIRNMAGEFFSFLSFDSLYFPEKIESQIKYIEQNKLMNTKTILYSNYTVIDEKGKIKEKVSSNFITQNKDSAYAITKNVTKLMTALIPKLAFDDVKLFDKSLNYEYDYNFLFELYKKEYKFILMHENLVAIRDYNNCSIKDDEVVDVEKNRLGLEIVNYFNDSARKKLYGSDYGYYNCLYKLFREKGYSKARDYCEKCYKNIEDQYEEKARNTKVSIILPFYNSVDATIDTINSILRQTHKNIELFVINNSSEENVDLIKNIADKNKSIVKYIEYFERKDEIDIYNDFIDEATGDYIIFYKINYIMCDDRIQVQLRKMMASNSIISCMNLYVKDGDKKELVKVDDIDGIMPYKVICDCIELPVVMLYRPYLIDSKIRFNKDNIDAEKICFLIDIVKDNYMIGIEEPLIILYGKRVQPKNTINKMNSIMHSITGISNQEMNYKMEFIHTIYNNTIVNYNSNNCLDAIHNDEIHRYEYLQSNEGKMVACIRKIIKTLLLRKEIQTYKLDTYTIENSRLNRIYRKLRRTIKRKE